MLILIGVVIVFGSVIGGYLIEGGSLQILLQFVEFLEMLGRIAQIKFKDNPEINEGYTLAQKLEKVLDIVL